MRVPVDETQVVEAEGGRQATYEHSTEGQTILVCLFVRGQIIDIVNFHMENCIECTNCQITYGNC